jgi:hypothetical protein
MASTDLSVALRFAFKHGAHDGGMEEAEHDRRTMVAIEH